ncbi:hypothetical protein CLIB1423_21S01244 [[Candida] railenensis]|uniref:Rab-GAP TBC domain-containing protein n=1 Tax=[Candida] railenensis TaxID=45579 RepID=A0A9P0QV13_9ASCO|nr:hypothetical protein CLIB1423_21S01244 [[Candida] railenensis]
MPNPSSLFPDSSNSSEVQDILFGRSSNRSLGGNLHDLSEAQISKLIHLKFDNNPITLIRQLSSDLTSKERDLILLRKEKFAREQLLLKLLSEYGNLSSLEIDQKLNTLKIDNNADNVLHDLIESAMDEHLNPESNPSINNRMSIKPTESYRLRSKSDQLRSPPERTSQVTSPIEVLSNTSSNSTTHNHSHNNNSNNNNNNNRSSSWLGNWFNHNDGSNENLPGTQGRPQSKSFSLQIGPFGSTSSLSSSNTGNGVNSGGGNGAESSKVPVELDSIKVRRPYEDRTPLSAGVDKFGFFNDMPKEAQKSNELLSDEEEGEEEEEEEDDDYDANTSGISESKPFISTLVETNDLEANGTYLSTSKAKNTVTSLDTLKQLSRMHDEKSKQYEDEWETFFKSLQRDYYYSSNKNKVKIENIPEKDQNNTFNSLYSSANEIFGLKGLNLIKLEKIINKQQPHHHVGHVPLSSDINSTSYFKKLHKLIQKMGIPPKYRSQLWFELSGSKNLKVPGEFDRLYNLSISSVNDPLIESNINQVNLDLHRTMPSNIYFNDVVNSQPGPNYYRLQKILYAFVVYKPKIGYCQGMNKIISNLLLGGGATAASNNEEDEKWSVNLTEEDIFWIFVGFIDELLPTYSKDFKDYNFFDNKSLLYIGIDQKILSDVYFPRFLPNLRKHFKTLNIQIEYITLNWWVSIFTENCLPIEIWIKFFDNFLVSLNVEILFFSISLSLFKNFEKLLLSISNADDIYLIMKNLNQNNSTKSNLKYSELMQLSKSFEKKIDGQEIESLRMMYG